MKYIRQYRCPIVVLLVFVLGWSRPYQVAAAGLDPYPHRCITTSQRVPAASHDAGSCDGIFMQPWGYVRADVDGEGYDVVVGVRAPLGRVRAATSGGSLQGRINASNFGGRGEGMKPEHVGLLIGGVALVAVLIAVAVNDDGDDDGGLDSAASGSRYVATSASTETPGSTSAASGKTGSTSRSTDQSESSTTTSTDGNTTRTVTVTSSSSSSQSSSSSHTEG